MSLVPEQDAFLRDVVFLLKFAFNWCDQKGKEFYVTELLRTEAQEAIYVKSGASSTMNSMHLKK